MKTIKIGLIIFLLISACSPSSRITHENIIRGKVIDEQGNVISGADIIEYDEFDRKINGTVSNINGDFVFKLKRPWNDTKVQVSQKGYKAQQIDLDKNRVIMVKLEPAKSSQNEGEPE